MESSQRADSLSVRAGTGIIASDLTRQKLTVRLARNEDRETIYRLRHEVYARELGQHTPNCNGSLSDALDGFNVYIVATLGPTIVGFISVTPPGGPSYSIDKYLKRDQLPFPFDDRLYEIRLLTVPQTARGNVLAMTLMWAAFRWVEAHGGTRIMAIGRREIVGMYFKVGLKAVGISVKAGAVDYEVLQQTMQDAHEAERGFRKILERFAATGSWELGIPLFTPAPCYHGGDFFTAVGDDFTSLEKLDSVINADVLDAWFPPSPKVLSALQQHLPALLRTSPPTSCEGLIRVIARARGVKPDCILPGGGSSDLIFLALRHWLTPESRVLILDPSYGEYAHVLERVIRCQVKRLILDRNDDYKLNLTDLESHLALDFDLVILVNPNSPTGQHVLRAELEKTLRKAPRETRIWIDETYIDYTGPGQSLEAFAAASENVVVCKSMSKTYALSGARVAYLCAAPHQLEPLKAISPPWAVGLPSQVAAVNALQDQEYYRARYLETHELRSELTRLLQDMDWHIVPSAANFLLCHLPESGPNASTLIARCRERGLFLRDTTQMGTSLDSWTIRVAVKDRDTNLRMAEIIRHAISKIGARD